MISVKTKTVFVCQSCGGEHSKWQGQCAGCNEWNTLVSEDRAARRAGYAGDVAQLVSIGEVDLTSTPRVPTGLDEFDHVLGGGLVPGSVVLIGGDPGVGKSTLLLQVMSHLSSKKQKVLYCTGEESPQQIALRSHRLQLNCDQLPLLAETSMQHILKHVNSLSPQILVIDSIQTIFSDQITAAPGSISQVRDCAAQLVRLAKQKNITVILIGHVTKEGTLAGPRVLEHMVDTVLYFEGQTDNRFRAVRAVKNRFGAVNELGVFAMTDTGLKVLRNPSAIFLSHGQVEAPGGVAMVTWEGSRPLLVEVQALVDDSHLANPRRLSVGLEHNRLSLLLAVLHRHAGIATSANDVFVNVVGGFRVTETAADLAVLCAVISSLRNRAMSRDLIVFGEIGLSGEVRPVPSGQERLYEAAKQGFKKAIVPKANAPKKAIKGMQVVTVEHLQQVLDQI